MMIEFDARKEKVIKVYCYFRRVEKLSKLEDMSHVAREESFGFFFFGGGINETYGL
jgi:hypothetical protein